MHKLLSLPENLVHSFHEITGNSRDQWFVMSDPEGSKIGSGGGTAWLLAGHQKCINHSGVFADYLAADKKIIIHAGGQSRRLPAYAPSGKILAPVPVFRWSRGQRIDQTLLDLQLPILERIMEASGAGQHVMIAAGDVLLQSPEIPFTLPDADVVCFGIWTDPHLASRHGVFFTPRNNPQQLDFMLQKADLGTIERLSESHLYLMDVGVWILSDKAVDLLMRKCGWNGSDFRNRTPDFYDLYSSFGTCLGDYPSMADPEIGQLSSAVVPLNKGVFYHYGTSPELISSTENIQNRIQDQRNIMHNRVKPHPSIFVQNALADIDWTSRHHHVWIENSHIPSTWTIQNHHVITGIPGNDWAISLDSGLCLDFVPVGDQEYCIRAYGMQDSFNGQVGNAGTLWMEKPLKQWFEQRGMLFDQAGLTHDMDVQTAPLFPVLKIPEVTEVMIQWILRGENLPDQRALWLASERLSAADISAKANLKRLFSQRERFRQQNLQKLSVNYKRSVFYQSDLRHMAGEFAKGRLALPEPLPVNESPMLRFRDHMFRSEVMRLKGIDGGKEEALAFDVLRTAITSPALRKQMPKLNVFADQIVWGRSPARLDLAGGWSDTPPYCLQHGGAVLNMAVDLNGQPPIQVYIRHCPEKRITLRSIDNGVSETVSSFDELLLYNQVGSAFSIPKAALYMAGFHPDFCEVRYRSLEEQLDDFGGGFEISLLAAIPKGSGLGTSSILAATLLGSLSDFCSLKWDQQVICHNTLILEQLLTTGGGWQDQYGGILHGIKLIETDPGQQEKVGVRWMPEGLFSNMEYKDNWLLYFTGITRVAKNILSDIVRGMFLNEGHRLRILDEIKQHAYHMADAMQRSDYGLTAGMIARSWKLNNALDSGTNTPEIEQIINHISDLALGYKLPGAGGGGYMLIAARDKDAASRIQSVLTQNPLNKKARFVQMNVSQVGFQVTRS